MSNTGLLTRTEPLVSAPPMARANTVLSWLPSALILTIVFISFRPFSFEQSVSTVQTNSGGDTVNQIGFGLLGLICAFLLAKRVPRDVLAAALNPVWFLVLCVLALSVYTADYPPGAVRAMVFSIIVVVAGATALMLPRSMSDMVLALSTATLIAIVCCYIAVFIFPEKGVHGGGGFEPQHEGLWRGVYSHKNVASYVGGAFALIGWFTLRNGRPKTGLLITVLSIIFVTQAGSKTVLAILPVAFVVVQFARWVTWDLARIVLLVLPLAALGFATMGAVLHPPLLEWLQTFVPGLTYTGRTDLWTFGLQFVALEPWVGYGFESFWGTARVTNLEQPIELSWDVRGIVHGHNSWIDAAVNFGIPGAIVMLLALFVLPLRDFLSIPDGGNAGRLAKLFIGIWLFTLLGANLESFYFRRADPVWFSLVLAVVGLRITAHMTSKSAAQAA